MSKTDAPKPSPAPKPKAAAPRTSADVLAELDAATAQLDAHRAGPKADHGKLHTQHYVVARLQEELAAVRLAEHEARVAQA